MDIRPRSWLSEAHKEAMLLLLLVRFVRLASCRAALRFGWQRCKIMLASVTLDNESRMPAEGRLTGNGRQVRLFCS